MSLTIRPLPAALGAEVAGLDLRRPLDAAAAAALHAAWLDHIVLIVRDQTLTAGQQIRFAGNFGAVGERATPTHRRNEGGDGYDGTIMLVTNRRDEAGRPLGSLPDGEMWFHHDMSYRPEPHKMTLLHALELPSEGGNTKFANLYAAYDAIPAGLKAKLAGRKVLQAYDFALIGRVDVDAGLDGIQHHWQPIFVRHPETGRTALYVSRLISGAIEGLERAESDDVLARLFEIAEHPSVVYEHVWRVGDLVLWDNRCSCHARTDFPRAEPRLLRRCTVEGGPMIAAG